MGQAQALREHLEKLAPSLTQENPTIKRDFNEVQLTPEEEQEALRKAREEKHYAEETRKYWEEKVIKEPEIKSYTTKQLKWKLKGSKNSFGKPFVIDDHNKFIAGMLCQYFACDPEFEKQKDVAGNNYSLTKGIALLGNVGVGKTYLMAFFFQNQNQSYTMANCRKIEGLWIDQMSNKDKPTKNVIEYYSTAIPTAINTNPFGASALGTCFDDLGTETSPSKSYGEEKNVLGEILMNRYESGLPFNYTHITTNLSAHDIGIKYGVRVRDRFREMFNMITFDNEAKSRR